MSALAIAKANILINNYGIISPDNIDLEAIAYGLGVIILHKQLNGCEGRLVNNGKFGVIVVNNGIREPGKQRFVIAHELGHFVLRKQERIPVNICDEHALINWHKNGEQENEANIFASSLLLPEKLFNDFCVGKTFSKDLIYKLANYFNCSLSATILRYAEIGHKPIAAVCTINKSIQWYRCNKHFPYQFLDLRTQIDTRSFAYDFFNKGTVPDSPEIIASDVWFKNDFKNNRTIKLVEQNIPLRSYNAVLSLIWEA